MRLRIPLAIAASLVLPSIVDAAPITGHWITHKSKAVVRISQCGPGLCGQIVWLRQGVDRKGQPVRDIRNRNKSLRGRQVLGLTTFSRLSPSGPGRWSGVMYNPDDGRTYNGSLILTGANSIRVEGCRSGGGACGKRNWTRARK